jgi:hypothetical protein
VLFARGFGEGGNPLPTGVGKRQGKRWTKSTLPSATFSCKETEGDEDQIRMGPDLWEADG